MDEYLNQLSELQNLLLAYLDIELEEINEDEANYKNLIQYLTKNEILTNKNYLKTFLQILINNANNHFRLIHFYSKIDLILSSIKSFISKFYSNEEIFELFKSNKRIIFYLLKEKLLYFDSDMKTRIQKQFNYCQYFQNYVEFTNDIRYRIKLNEKYQNEGENESDIAEIIRKDQLDDFIHMIETSKISINSDIEESIYETNEYMNSNLFPRYNEYAAFFGSISIFKYLCMNDAQFHPLIWKCAIHGRNYEIIHIIENQEKFTYKYYENDDIEGNLKEAIKCHHNEIAYYYYDNFCSDLDINLSIIEECIKSFNIVFLNEYFKDQFIDALNTKTQSIFEFLVANDYADFISILLKQDNLKNDCKLILNSFFYEVLLSNAIQSKSYRTIEFLLTIEKLDINEAASPDGDFKKIFIIYLILLYI